MWRMGWTQTRAGRSQLYGMWWPARHTELNKHPKAARIEITASLNSNRLFFPSLAQNTSLQGHLLVM